MKQKVVVFGASGRLGRQIVEGLLTCGYVVRAFVHTNNALTEHERLEVVSGDVHKKNDVADAINGTG